MEEDDLPLKRFPGPTINPISVQIDLDDEDSSSICSKDTYASTIVFLDDASHAMRTSTNPKPVKAMFTSLILFCGFTVALVSITINFGGVTEKNSRTSIFYKTREDWTLPELEEYPPDSFVIDKEACQSCCYEMNTQFDGNIIHDPVNGNPAPDGDLFHYYTCHDVGCIGYEFDCDSVPQFVNHNGKPHKRGNSVRGCNIGQQIRLGGEFLFMPPDYVAAGRDDIDNETTYHFTCNENGTVSLGPEYEPNVPTNSPTPYPSRPVTDSPTESPLESPTQSPLESPTKNPTQSPVEDPTENPTQSPVEDPTPNPTQSPVEDATLNPTKSPVLEPTPTQSPVEEPTPNPTPAPTQETTSEPTISPVSEPTATPTQSPVESPTLSPTTPEPTQNPTTGTPTDNPTTSEPTESPTRRPTLPPGQTRSPTESPTGSPSEAPTPDPEGGSIPVDEEIVVQNLGWVGGASGISSSTIVAGLLNFRVVF